MWEDIDVYGNTCYSPPKQIEQEILQTHLQKTMLWHNQSVKSVTFLDENVKEAKQVKEKMETSWLDDRIYMFE